MAGGSDLDAMETLFSDIRYAIRSLLKRPGFSAIIVLTLTLGIGANTAIFTVTNAVMLRVLPVRDPQQLVILSDPDSQGWRKGSETETRTLFSYHEFEWLRDHNQVFSGIFASNSNLLRLDVADANASQSSDSTPARVSLVSGAYFSVLGVNAIRGRTFSEDVDKARDANPVAVISYDYWKNHYALNPAALSSKIRIRQTTFDIIGVTPEGFSGETVGHATDIWIPSTMQMEVVPAWGDALSPPKIRSEGQVMWLQVMARLKPGVTAAQARASINLVFQQLLQAEAGEVSADERREYLNQNIALVEGSRGASTMHESFGQRESAVGARHCTSEGNRLARDLGSYPKTARAATFDGKLSAGADRRRVGFAFCSMGRCGPPATGFLRRVPGAARSSSGRANSSLHAGDLDTCGNFVWSGAGYSSDSCRFKRRT